MDIEEELKILSENLIERDMFSGNKLYLDLRLFFDFTIGNLLHLNKSDKDKRQYIYNQISNYKKYKEIDLKVTFPEINTDEEILKENIKEHSNQIFASSPMTLFYETFKIDICLIQNHIHALTNNKMIILNINTYPLKLDRKILSIVKKLFEKDIQHVKVNFMYRNLETTKQEDKFRKFDIYFVYYFPELSVNENILDMFDKLKYEDKSFYIYLPTDDAKAKEFVAIAYSQYFKDVKIIDKALCMPLKVGDAKTWKNKTKRKI